MADNEAGEAESGIARGIFLIIGGFVGFVDDNETEVVNRGEEGGTRTDDDERLGSRRIFGCARETRASARLV